MNDWYTPQQAAKLKKRAGLCKWLMILLGAASLAGCIFLCTRVTTGTASRLLGLTIALSAGGGWAVMLLWVFGFRPLKAQADHMQSLLETPCETCTGLLSVSGYSFQIPGSIVVRKARLKTPEETLSLNLNDRFAAKLPPDGTPVRVTTARSFITGVEVCEDENG